MSAKNKLHESRLRVIRFEPGDAARWDAFIDDDAYNGAFCATRRFLGYHPADRFEDCSLLLLTPDDRLAAIVPACVLRDGDRRIFYSHRGTSFGGVIVARRYFEVTYLRDIIAALDCHWREEGFAEVVLRQVPSIFSAGSVHSLDYLLSAAGFRRQDDLSFVVPLAEMPGDDPLVWFRDRARQQVLQGLKTGLVVRELVAESEVAAFHAVLAGNLAKHGAGPVHSVPELLELRARFPGVVTLFGCFRDHSLLGGTMMWAYGDRVLHEQNMGTDPAASGLRPANVLNYRMIEEAVRRRVRYFSFGISTEQGGRVLNFGLARFKEGFGARGYLNNIYSREHG